MTQHQASPFPQSRSAVVSGCGAPRGIGRVTARRLAVDGWNLAVVDISPAVLEFAAELQGEFPDLRIVGRQLDITDEADVAAAFEAFAADLPPIIGEANIAGIACPTPLLELTAEEFDKVMAVNARGTMLMMKYAAMEMKKHGVGRIVNFSSITAFDGGGTFSKIAYAGAKAAVIGLSRGGARELGQYGITCNTICPGPVDTDIMGGKLTDDRKDLMSSNIPVGRVSSPADQAAVVNFLLSEEAAFVSGATLNVDGGKHMR